MTKWGYEGNDNAGQGNDTEANGPKALRDAYDRLKQQNEELNGKLTSFLEEQAREKMSKVFESLGVPGAQAVYQGPNDPQKAKEWVDSMRSVFGNPGGTPPVVEQPVTPALPASMQAQFERMTEAGQQGVPVGGFEAAQASINDASTSADIIAAFQRMNHTG